MSNTLIVNISINSPEIRIIGPIRENTIEKLNQVLPMATTSTRSGRAGQPKFQYLSNPNHWYVKLDGQFCDQVGVCALFLVLFDALEEEGGWKMSTTHALTCEHIGAQQQDAVEQYKFFFSRLV